MRIALIITDYGAFNNFLAELSVKLIDNNNQVHVICSQEKVINRKDKFDYINIGIKFHYIDFPRSFNLYKQIKASRKIHSTLNQIKPDIVHINFTTAAFTTFLTGKLKFRSLTTFHGLGYPVLKGIKKNIFRIVEFFCFKMTDQIWLLNSDDYNIIKSKYPNKTKIYNSAGLGCDLSKFNPSLFDDRVKIVIKKELGINSKDFVLAFTGRFVSFKGFDLVAKSFLQISRNNKNIKLLLLGGNDPIHPTGLNDKEEGELKNNKDVINIGFTSKIEKYLAVADLFIFPSIKEGMPVCIIESLAMEVPVVSANSRGCRDLIKNNYNGLLISNPPKVEELISKILFLFNNRDLLSKFADNAKKDKKYYDRNSYIKEQIDIYSNNLHL